MSKNKTNTAKGNEPTVDNMTQLVLEEGKKIAKEDFAKFSAIIVAISSVVLWIIKSIWYAYWSGRFWIYKIDASYINTDSESILLQIIQVAAIIVMGGISNYIYYKISVEKDKSKFYWKRKLSKLAFWIGEMIILLAIILFLGDISFWELVNGIELRSVIAITIGLFIICFMINIYAIDYVRDERRKNKRPEKAVVHKNVENDNEKRIISLLIFLIFIMAMILIAVFFISKQIERDRHGYKVIMIQSEETAESEFDIEYTGDNCKYKMYPVVYENQDCYIIVRMYNEDGKINIDYNYQRIIEKEGQETIYLDNVYNVSGGNLTTEKKMY